jgi:hypothetical protein
MIQSPPVLAGAPLRGAITFNVRAVLSHQRVLVENHPLYQKSSMREVRTRSTRKLGRVLAISASAAMRSNHDGSDEGNARACV